MSASERRTLESNLVPLERVHRLLKEGSILGRVARDVEALKLDGNVDVLSKEERGGVSFGVG